MTGLIVAASIVAYLALTLTAARIRYNALRPWTEPLNCKTTYSCSPGRHHRSCYRRGYSLIDTSGEAAMYALLQGLAWWALLPLALASWFIRRGHRPLLEEVQARNARLERELGMRP